jgi:hypothetical protein
MATAYSTSILNQSSQKKVIADYRPRKHFFGWITNGDTTYYQVSQEDANALDIERVTRVMENDVEATEEASQAALNSSTTTTVGGWFFDWDDGRLYYKPKASTTPYENFVLANIQFRFSNFGGEDAESLPLSPFITSSPRLNMRVSRTFNATLGQTGSGNLGLANADSFMARTDYEPDARIDVSELFGTFGGV